jgi:Icc-related predicted phosphoesterase
MKLVIISDTHTFHKKMTSPIPDGDVLIHCGDICNQGFMFEVTDFIDWFIGHPHKYKIFIAGNHDFALMKKIQKIRGILDSLALENVFYLEDSGVTIGNVNFWGSPWQPEFHNWAFNLPRGKPLKEKWDLIPSNTNVLITHGPPKTDGNTDYVIYGEKNIGCEELAIKIEQLSELQVHCFGHIHEGYGVHQGPNKVQLVNAAICTTRYTPTNKPIVVEL